jgi:hypothetical protein
MAGDVAWGRERVVALRHADITPHLQLSWNLKLRCKLRLGMSLSCMTVRKLSGVSSHHVGLTDDGVGVTLSVTWNGRLKGQQLKTTGQACEEATQMRVCFNFGILAAKNTAS